MQRVYFEEVTLGKGCGGLGQAAGQSRVHALLRRATAVDMGPSEEQCPAHLSTVCSGHAGEDCLSPRWLEVLLGLHLNVCQGPYGQTRSWGGVHHPEALQKVGDSLGS